MLCWPNQKKQWTSNLSIAMLYLQCMLFTNKLVKIDIFAGQTDVQGNLLNHSWIMLWVSHGKAGWYHVVIWLSVLLRLCNVLCMFCALQWWLDRHSEELLGEETARCLCEEEEHRKEALRLQQQEDERLALALSQEFIQHKLVSWDVGGRGRGWS